MFGKGDMVNKLKGAQPMLIKMAINNDPQFKGLADTFISINIERKKLGKFHFELEYKKVGGENAP